jgi:hypothetical protein
LDGQPLTPRQLLLAAVSLACAWSAPAALRAQPSAAAVTRPATVTLVQDACASASYDSMEFAKLLQIELQALGITSLELQRSVTELDPTTSGVAVVHMRCDAAAGHITVELADLATGKQVLRDLLVTDLEPAARPRALSMAVALLIENSWLELATRKALMSGTFALPDSVRAALRRRLVHALELDRTERPRPAKKPATKPTHESHAALALFAVARAFPTRNTGLLGIEFAYVPALGTTRLLVNVEAMTGDQEISDQLGPVAKMHMYWLSAGLSVLWSSSTRPELSLGPFAHIGYGVATASNVRADQVQRDGGGPIAAFGIATLLRAAVSADLDLWAGFDLGYVPIGVVFLADQNRTAGMAEISMSARAGIGFGF